MKKATLLKTAVRQLKNKIIIAVAVISAVALLSSCSKDKPIKAPDDTTVKEYPENGVYYEYSSGGNSDRVVSSITFKDGLAISSNEYDYWEDGKLKTVTTKVGDKTVEAWNYLYTEDGVLSQMVRTFTEDGAECRDDYKYNKDGKLDSLSWYTGEDYEGGYRYSYNDKGDPTLEEQLDRNGDVITYTEYTFNEKGYTEAAYHYQYGSVENHRIYEYDSENNLIAIVSYDRKDNVTGSIGYQYNNDGKLSRTTEYDKDKNVISYTESLYDSDGFNYRDIYYEDGKPIYCYDYTPDGPPIMSMY